MVTAEAQRCQDSLQQPGETQVGKAFLFLISARLKSFNTAQGQGDFQIASLMYFFD